MTASINQVIIPYVNEFGIFGSCELSIIFDDDHKYESMEEIQALLSEAGLSVGNFYFKGVSMWSYHYEDPKEDGQTSVLCIIPENIRKTFQINVTR